MLTLLNEVLHEVTRFFGSEELGVRQRLEGTTDHGRFSHVTIVSLAQFVKAPGPRFGGGLEVEQNKKFNPLIFPSGELDRQSTIQV